jgi:DNA (cytosine-5)-methyltransferase 1
MHSHHPVIPYVSLCSGYEGIGLGLHRCIPNLRAVAYCEREAFAVANLVAKMENGFLDSAPVFTDVATFPWAELTEVMAGGVLSFGWPCQPVSTAGKRKATEDERWLFDIIADGIAIMRPGILFAENVEGLLSAKMPDGSSVFGHCIQRLESLHYRVAAGIFSASEVGAPHQRKRVFILAYRIGAGWEGFARGMDVCGDGSESGGSVGQKGVRGRVWPSRPGERQYGWEPPRVVGVADTIISRSDGRPDGSCRWSRESGEAGVDATGSGSQGDGMRQTQPPLGGDTDGPASGMDYAQLSVSCDNRTDELRLLGNGVVPQTADLAFRVLIKELL